MTKKHAKKEKVVKKVEEAKDKAKNIENEIEKKVENIKEKVNKKIKEDKEKNGESFIFSFLKNCAKAFFSLTSKVNNVATLKFGQYNIHISKYGINTILIICSAFVVSFVIFGFNFITTVLLFLLLLTTYFFRDPERVLPEKQNVIISPCDGKILSIQTSNLPEELGIGGIKEYTKISIFLNFNNVHVQRIPVNCKVKRIEYIKGVFINSKLDKASKDNERNIVLFERENKDNICVVQIAGFISRRIVCNIEKEQICNIGERYGMIKFGSRVEIYLPKNYKIEVLSGQMVIGGETIIASF